MRYFDALFSPTLAVVATTLLNGAAHAQCPAADTFEPNETCAAAAPLTVGTYNGLTVMGTLNAGGVNDDCYSVTLPPGEILVVDCLFADVTGDIDVYFYDLASSPNCGGEGTSDYLVRGFTASDNEHVEYTNPTAGPLTIIVRVELYASYNCTNYDLVINTIPDPCAALSDDSFEPNDSCASAAALSGGSHAGLFVSESNKDFYAITVPAAHVLTVDVSYVSGVDADPDLYLFDDLSCTTQVDSNISFGGSGQVIWGNGAGVATTVILEVRVIVGEGCNNYDLNVVTLPDPCLSGTDDALEPNDSCAAAVALAAGAHSGLFVSDTAGDFYAISVPVGEILTVDVSYVSGVNADPDLYLYDDLACTNQVDVDLGAGGSGQVQWSNGTGATATVVLEARVITGDGCNTYDLNVSSTPDPCLDPLSDDGLEPNDDCFNALAMSDGTYPALFVSKTDHDFYEVTVADTDTLFVDLTFTHSTADVDVYIYDDQVACGDLTSYLVRGYTPTNNESISWTNATGAVKTYYIQVVVFALSGGECNNYDMQLTGSGAVLATPFCFGDGTADVGGGPVGCPCGNLSAVGAGEGCLSSLGMGAILTASGTTIVANDDLVFTVSQARANQPSMLVQGSTLVAFPFKDGILCMGNPTERVEVVFTDASGTGSTSSSIVTNGNVSPGDTRFYQQWFRDPGGVSPCGTGSNFSQGLSLTWM